VKAALAPLAHREFRLLFLGRAVSMIGSAMAPIALAFGVLELGGSAGDLGFVLTLSILPQVAFLLVGGVIADRLPRDRVMVASNVVSGAAQAVAAALLITGRAEIWHLAVVALVRAVATSFFFPAQQGIVPQTVPEELLQPANALLRLTLNVTNIAGAAVGGIVVAAAGPGWALGLDAASYAVAAALLLPMRILAPSGGRGGSFLAELRDGWAAFRSRTWLWVVVLGFGFANAASAAALNVLGPLIAEESLGGASTWGAILAAQGIGLVAGGLIALRVQPARPLLLGVTAAALLVPPLALLALRAPWPAVALAALLTGLGLELFSVLWDLSLQGHVPNEILSRVAAWDALGSWVLMPIAYALVGPLSEVVGTTTTLWGCAAITAVAIVAQLASRDVRALPHPSLRLVDAPGAA
jgi:predicted MFS family arabinose efflux permease